MLDEQIRTAILQLHEAGRGVRAIGRALGISRGSVRKVLASGTAKVAPLDRAERAEPYHDEIVEQVVQCQGNLMRVHEELEALGAELSYPALTAYCRRHHIGRETVRIPVYGQRAGQPVIML